SDFQAHALNFKMTAPGRYEASFPVSKAGAYAVTVTDVSDPRKPQSMVTGLANSYSAEFLQTDDDDGTLQQLGEIATGKSPASKVKNLAALDPRKCGLFAHDLPPVRQPTDLFWQLVLAALCLLPLDIAVRRLALDPEIALRWLFGKLRGWMPSLELARPK